VKKDKERKEPTKPMPLTEDRAWVIVRRAALARHAEMRKQADIHFTEPGLCDKADRIYYAVGMIDKKLATGTKCQS
jgi:hypothetical protein